MTSESGDHALELVTVFASGDPVRLTMAKLALESAGIQFVTQGEGVQDLIGAGRLFGGFNIAAGPVRIQVPQPEAAEARARLQDIAG